MARYLVTMAIFAALALASCASFRGVSSHDDGINQNTNAAMVGALNGMGR